MKQRLIIPALAAAGLIGWLVWPGPAARRPAVLAQTGGAMVAQTPALGVRNAGTVVSSSVDDEAANAALLEQVRALGEKLKTLQKVDSIENLQAAAEVELEFNALLNGKSAPLLIQQMPRDFVSTWLGDLTLRYWAGVERRAAAEWMAQHPSASQVAATALAHDWVIEDAAGLKAYLDGLPVGPWKHNVSKTAGEEALVADQPVQAIEFLNKIAGEDARRDELYEWSVTKWAITDPVAAIEWATKAASPAMRDRLVAAAAVGYANAEPEHAAQWAMSDARWEPALPSIARIWGAKDPETAAKWVQQYPGGLARDKMLESLIAVWGANDMKKANEWHLSLTDPVMREQAADALAKVRADFQFPSAN